MRNRPGPAARTDGPGAQRRRGRRRTAVKRAGPEPIMRPAPSGARVVRRSVALASPPPGTRKPPGGSQARAALRVHERNHDKENADRCHPRGRDPRGGGGRDPGRGIRLRVAEQAPARRQHLSRQGHPGRAVAAGGVRRLRRQPARVPGLLGNPPRLLPDSQGRPRGADRRGGGARPRGRGGGRAGEAQAAQPHAAAAAGRRPRPRAPRPPRTPSLVAPVADRRGRGRALEDVPPPSAAAGDIDIIVPDEPARAGGEATRSRGPGPTGRSRRRRRRTRRDRPTASYEAVGGDDAAEERAAAAPCRGRAATRSRR